MVFWYQDQAVLAKVLSLPLLLLFFPVHVLLSQPLIMKWNEWCKCVKLAHARKHGIYVNFSSSSVAVSESLVWPRSRWNDFTIHRTYILFLTSHHRTNSGRLQMQHFVFVFINYYRYVYIIYLVPFSELPFISVLLNVLCGYHRHNSFSFLYGLSVVVVIVFILPLNVLFAYTSRCFFFFSCLFFSFQFVYFSFKNWRNKNPIRFFFFTSSKWAQ